jgi:hypothetical protein
MVVKISFSGTDKQIVVKCRVRRTSTKKDPDLGFMQQTNMQSVTLCWIERSFLLYIVP